MAYLITIESSISSTPARGLAEKTGGTASVAAALTTRNSESWTLDSLSLFAGVGFNVDSFRFRLVIVKH